MAKLAACITPLMNDAELDDLLRDHYRCEAQTLTTGAEENLLKLSQLFDNQTEEEKSRWQDIRDEYVRYMKLGDDTDGMRQVPAPTSPPTTQTRSPVCFRRSIVSPGKVECPSRKK
jgi:hypothetical protein